MELYKDPHQPVEKRVEDLLSRMTLEEKAAQLCGDLPAGFMQDGQVSLELLREKYPNGHGRFTQYSLAGIVDPVQIAEISNMLQRYFVEETRLGIPVALQAENLCGYPGAGGTLFPAQINVGSTWMPELAEQMAAVIGQESRAVGINSAMSPVIDVSRDPRWGRTYETYGEDPYLISQMGIGYIRGMQGDKQNGPACIAKHFLGYADSQGGLNCAVSRINDRELYEVFATPFEAADKEANVSGMMANYGEIDGMCVGANKKIARTLLRDTMGFEGMLTSDGAAVMKMYNYFHIASTYKEAGLLAKKGGLDTEIPVGGAFRQLPDYVRSGELDEALIDESVRRILRIKFEYGLFEHPYVDVDRVRSAMTNEKKAALSRGIAEKSIVLLKNDGVLPLKKGTKLAVIGPHADNLRYPISGYTYPAYIEMMKAGAADNGSVSFNGIADEAAKDSEKTKKRGSNMFASMLALFTEEDRKKLDDLPTLLKKMGSRSLKDVLSDRFQVRYAPGCDIIGEDVSGFDAAVEAAKESDVVIMALGGNCGWVNVTGGEGKDRSHLSLPGVQQQLLEKVCAVGKPVVLVLYGPGIFALPWAKEHASAMVQAFMPGAEAGRVISDVLDGTVNPGGHLTFTVPHHIGQLPIVYNHRTGAGYSGGSDENASMIFSGGYVDDTDKPLFPFGHGLSYTTFSVSPMALSSDQMPTDGGVDVTCAVTNTGRVAGDQVVQLYYHFSGAHVIRPNMQLAAFQRVRLNPGERKEITFHLQASALGYYNEDMVFGVEPGPAELKLGVSSAEIIDEKPITLIGRPVALPGKRTYTCKTDVQ
ncbi:MAG: glycoside hydrolase family 3 C-terminal domain-containing protein [Clostridia bacterium]|nr:glycoside hydrolase family 3 C-terminal domain-containing protein [Clostridia bacterium]